MFVLFINSASTTVLSGVTDPSFSRSSAGGNSLTVWRRFVRRGRDHPSGDERTDHADGRDVPSKYAVQDAPMNLLSKELPFIWICCTTYLVKMAPLKFRGA